MTRYRQLKSAKGRKPPRLRHQTRGPGNPGKSVAIQHVYEFHLMTKIYSASWVQPAYSPTIADGAIAVDGERNP